MGAWEDHRRWLSSFERQRIGMEPWVNESSELSVVSEEEGKSRMTESDGWLVEIRQRSGWVRLSISAVET